MQMRISMRRHQITCPHLQLVFVSIQFQLQDCSLNFRANSIDQMACKSNGCSSSSNRVLLDTEPSKCKTQIARLGIGHPFPSSLQSMQCNLTLVHAQNSFAKNIAVFATNIEQDFPGSGTPVVLYAAFGVQASVSPRSLSFKI